MKYLKRKYIIIMKNDNESIQEIIDNMSIGKRKYEEKKSLKKGFKSIEDYIIHGLNILNKPSNIKETNIKKPLLQASQILSTASSILYCGLKPSILWILSEFIGF